MTEEVLVTVAQDGAIAEITIDNPPANALTNALYERLQTLATDLENDASVRAIVFVSAHPTIFVAGADIGAMASYEFASETIERKVNSVHQTFLRLQRLSKPTLASIEGHALGGGCELALSLDMRFMSRGKARIGLPEAGLGIIPGGGGTQRLPRLIGRGRATQMMMLGERLDADAAERCGLVNAACADAAATRAATHDMARRLAEMPSSSLRLIKRCLNDGYDSGLADGLEIERAAAIEALLQPEAREGIAAFLERRPARFHVSEPA